MSETYGLGSVDAPPPPKEVLRVHSELRQSHGKAQDFRKRNQTGSKAQALVEEALSRTGRKFTVIDGKNPEQAHGDLRLDGAKYPTYVEVKANANYDDHLQLFNVYFELMEYYLPEYQHNRKARTVEVSGFLKQLDGEVRTLFAHKLGSTDRWLVYTPASILAYFLYSRETQWERDAIDSRADQDSKKKVGLRIKAMHPDTIEEDFALSGLSRYAHLVPTSGLVKALATVASSYEGMDEDVVVAYRQLARKYYSDATLKKYKDWWYYPTAARHTEGN